MSSAPSFNIAKGLIENMLNEFPPLSNENSLGVINQFNLTKLFPNPFNPVLNIDFEINQAGLVEVKISDITGSMVKTVYEGFEGAGKHQINWNSENLPSGVYFVSLQAGGNSLTKKVVLLK
ncbi:T9SS type A sorting domain-containing protein [Marine Group I thaumarchaeote]|uniref:T9SS type A sorting domain-containing protein n=1 Tax=Marine Group I thaumarchaeote TaxID=2511932 RepID=A0A7K4MRM2_9ARCH|nr:T9SS type A sorting domain-containing protein [Marine Group I thaumarchaeote]